MDKTYELIFCVVNTGFSGTVMDAARSAGATGGTILRGRGSAGKEAEDFFHIQIEPEKEIVMIDDTPRFALVFNTIPSARTNIPSIYTIIRFTIFLIFPFYRYVIFYAKINETPITPHN